MNSFITSAYGFFQVAVFVFLAIPTLYLFIFAFAGLFYRQPVVSGKPVMRKIAILIPGYKEDSVIVDVARDATKQDYPQELMDVIVIADSFQPATLEQLKNLPVKVLEVEFEESTKSKAINAAFERLPDDYDIVVILDADNLMAPDFLKKMNAAFEPGRMAVQGHRTAKNLDSSLAVLDAISEEINNNIFRKGHRVLGLSSAIIGSGMAFRYDYFRKLMSTVTAVGGFDKEIELKMLKEGHRIAYLDDAIVYDEKVQKAESFSNQRRRWLSAQLIYFRKAIGHALSSLFLSGNIDYFDKTVQFIMPPRILLLGALLLFGTLFSLADLLWGINPAFTYFWLVLTALCLLAFLFSVPLRFYRWQTVSAMGSLPRGMMLMILAMLKIKGANRQFLHTRHEAVSTRLLEYSDHEQRD
ncbi:MAG: glycosyltransferase family 2 protein [Bacteroidetes bacterium]|nr:glycosyltransferase family 2 protein [Bacteroidota bacterium]